MVGCLLFYRVFVSEGTEASNIAMAVSNFTREGKSASAIRRLRGFKCRGVCCRSQRARSVCSRFGIVSVVGSNCRVLVSEEMLFILGQLPEQLRNSKLADLFHN